MGSFLNAKITPTVTVTPTINLTVNTPPSPKPFDPSKLLMTFQNARTIQNQNLLALVKSLRPAPLPVPAPPPAPVVVVKENPVLPKTLSGIESNLEKNISAVGSLASSVKKSTSATQGLLSGLFSATAKTSEQIKQQSAATQGLLGGLFSATVNTGEELKKQSGQTQSLLGGLFSSSLQTNSLLGNLAQKQDEANAKETKIVVPQSEKTSDNTIPIVLLGLGVVVFLFSR